VQRLTSRVTSSFGTVANRAVSDSDSIHPVISLIMTIASSKLQPNRIKIATGHSPVPTTAMPVSVISLQATQAPSPTSAGRAGDAEPPVRNRALPACDEVVCSGKRDVPDSNPARRLS